MPDRVDADQTRKPEPKSDIKDLPKNDKDLQRPGAEADKIKGGGGVRNPSV